MSRRQLHLASPVLLFPIVLLCCISTAGADTLNVGVGQDYATIAAALAASGDGTGDIINVVDPNDTEAGIVVDKSVTIQGQGMDATIVQAHAVTPDRVFSVSAEKAVTIKDMTVRHGCVYTMYEVAAGGGIRNSGILTLISVRVTANECRNSFANPIPHYPGYGGGIANLADANCVVQSSTFSNNQALGGTSDVGAVGGSYGGGAIDSQSDPNSTESMTFINSTISGNLAGRGGGIYGSRGIVLSCSTVAENRASYGGGIHSGTDPNAPGPSLFGTILADNIGVFGGNDALGVVQSKGYSLIEDANDATIVVSGGDNILGQDPLLGPLADNGGPTKTHALLTGSPALDQIPVGTNGVGTDPLDKDRRGVARPQGTQCDIGAFELTVEEDGPAPACCGTSAAAVMPFVGMVLLMLARPPRRHDRRQRR